MTVFQQGEQVKTPAPGQLKLPAIVLAGPDERQESLALTGLSSPAYGADDHNRATRYEFHREYDYLCVQMPDFDDAEREPAQLEAWLAKDLLLVWSDDAHLTDCLAREVTALTAEEQTPVRTLYLLIAQILAGGPARLDAIEDEIGDMEEMVFAKRTHHFTETMFLLRKRLLVLGRYYQSLYEAMDDLEENQNGFYTKNQLRGFGLHADRLDRLSRTVEHLRDYLTQVREAYQSETDITLNKTMQLFTVITVIFTPLTLIVGWYGMNLQMPEFGWPLMYPAVIIGSVAITVVSLWVFKKKGWF